MPVVAGVDGCPGGWVAALVDESSRSVAWRLAADAPSVVALLDDPGVAVIGIDIPIGLPRPGEARTCDLLARAALGPRRSCVFPAPSRQVLAEDDFRRANDVSRRLGGKGLSKQAFFIGARIVDVDRALEPALADRVVEVHPELTFARLAGAAIGTKKSAAGLARRAELLRTWLPDVDSHLRARPRRAKEADALDALAAAWSATRWRAGQAESLPAEPPYDERGLPMRIVS